MAKAKTRKPASKKEDLSDLEKHPLERTELLVMRTCNADMSSAHTKTFIWPEKGWIEAPDWVDSAGCGHGLHGLPWGVGDSGLLNWSHDAKWLIVRVNKSDGYVEFSDKCKYRRGFVVYAGERHEAATILVKHGACSFGAVVGAVVSAGY